MPGIVEKHNKKRVSRNGKDTLEDQCPEHANERIGTGPSCIGVIVFVEGSGDQRLKINMIFKQ